MLHRAEDCLCCRFSVHVGEPGKPCKAFTAPVKAPNGWTSKSVKPQESAPV